MLLQLFGTMLGIKVLNVVTNKVVRVLGSRESNERFLSASLYQVGSEHMWHVLAS
jgi:peptidylprolyl isomerase domain and WD repeat-containing protein 1